MKTFDFKRIVSLALCLVLVLTWLPVSALRTTAADEGGITLVADPDTTSRPELIYGNNTLNSGKVTVGKSVSTEDITVNGQSIALTGDNNMLVTMTQFAQVMGLSKETSVPVDVVFVLDTSGSMSGTPVRNMITAANDAIATLMSANEHNRVAVVAFSGDEGGGTSGGDSANILSHLAHYTGDAATDHIQWVDSTGVVNRRENRNTYIQGRGTDAGRRQGTSMGTNIHAGVALGGSILAEEESTTVVDAAGQVVARMPFLVIMSDGDPTIAVDGTWYDPEDLGDTVGNISVEDGLGWMAAMTAAYYKGRITENYFGDEAGANNHAFVYTMGLNLDSDGLAEMTMNPSGNGDNEHRDAFESYWASHQTGRSYDVDIGWGDYTFTAASIAASNPYVLATGLGYTGGYRYNDAYFSISSAGDLSDAFSSVVTTIQQKAITVPTRVTTGDLDFDGYVTFTDPLGEFMELKDMKGVLADGYFYRGISFARFIENFGTASANPDFDAQMREVMQNRLSVNSDTVDIEGFINGARNSPNQAYYNSDTDYDNSIVWWGRSFHSGEEDLQMQTLGIADNDTIDYITDEATVIPEGAEYVCRSYFFYGDAGGQSPTQTEDYLYFIVRVQRELTAPYRQTVVISIPASLLAMERVLITETTGDDGLPQYTATVDHEEPLRVVYEVGLWDSINAQTVSAIVGDDYRSETVNGEGSVNYDPATDSYSFFVSDWDRTESIESHHRALTRVTFDAAQDNSYYAYQQDTLLVDAQGNPVTGDPRGTTVYYSRPYYSWSDQEVDGTYAATAQSQLIAVAIPAEAKLVQRDGRWYIPQGAYTASTLVANGEDTVKDQNLTGTSSVVVHPHRTGSSGNSHYTVYLGNNGKLTLVSDPYVPQKTVSINAQPGATQLTDQNGQPVKVGDVLTYTIEAKNLLAEAVDITVTDVIPAGTAFVPGSAGSGTAPTGHTADATLAPDATNTLTWVLQAVPAGQTRYVSFKVEVTEAALDLTALPGQLTNTARVAIGNNPAVSTNPTHNSVDGKTVTNTAGAVVDGQGGYGVGSELVFYIRYHNDATDAQGAPVAADITIVDPLPAGTDFISADNGGVYDAATNTVTWRFADVSANSSGLVSLRVRINASAKVDGSADIQPAEGQAAITNTAGITVNNEPTIYTNTTQTLVAVGDIAISKTVAQGGDTSKDFTITLTESTGTLAGKYPATGGSADFVEFAGGEARLTIRHGQTVTVQGLPVGTILAVEEDVSALPGWTPTYSTRSITVTEGAAAAVSSVSVVNTYRVEPLTVTLNATKTLLGQSLPAAVEFGFVALADAGNPVVGDPLTGRVSVQDTGTYRFTMGTKTFVLPGVYRYTISELAGGKTGVTYDQTVHQLVITVTDNGDGTLSATATLNGQAATADTTIDFTNTYNPEDSHLVFTADKALTGRTLTAGEFSFALTDGVNTYRGINDEKGNIVFEALTFSQVGTYRFTLTEEVPDQAAKGISYDTASHTVVVTVTDQNGVLTPSITVNGAPITVVDGVADTGVLFTNSFAPDDVPLTLVANKNLKVWNGTSYDDAAMEAGRFRFQVVDTATGNVVSTGTNEPSGLIVFNTIYFSDEMLAGVAPNGSGDRVKTFTFAISEVVTGLAQDPNMLYDTAVRQVQATLTYKASGELSIAVDGDSDGRVQTGIQFVNYSNPDTVSVVPTGKKTTNGSNLPAGLSFSFRVVPVGSTQDAATGTSTATVGGGSSETVPIRFTSMVYSSSLLGSQTSRSFDYWLMESNAAAGTTTGSNGVTYDSTRYLYRVTLSRNSYNRLVATEAYFALRAGGDAQNAAHYTVAVEAAQVSFVNTYAAEAHLNLTATKVLTGNRPLAAEEFDFLLRRLDSTGKLVEGSHITGTNDARGVISFGTLNYSSAMLQDAYKAADGAFYFSYLLSEVQPEGVAIPGVTYDPGLYVVTVKVTQTAQGLTAQLGGVSNAVQDQDGSYSPGEPISFGQDGATNVSFYNRYQAVEGDEIKVKLHKSLTGRSLRAGEFEFGLYENDELVYVATNDASGAVIFSRTVPASAATTHAGMHKLVVKELPGSIPGVSYSTQAFEVFVKITDTGTGKVEATVHLSADGPALAEDADGFVVLPDSYTFTNTYKPSGTTFAPTATKELTGRDLYAGEFSFQAQLVAVNGTAQQNGPVYRGVNDARGGVLFQSISFTEPGVYLYRITEVGGSLSGIRYDSAAYYLAVTVADNGQGSLQATGTYYADEAATQPVNAVTFRNSYTPGDARVALTATKELTGRALRDGEFSFLVYEGTAPGGRLVSVGENDAQGNIVFSTFNITSADMGGQSEKTFRYVMVEADNQIPGVTIDTAVHPITVTVTDDGSGSLSASVSYEGGPVTFKNTYAPTPVDRPLAVYKVLTGRALKAGQFRFALYDAGDKLLQTATNDADGVATFEDLRFTQAGTYTYHIRELAGDLAGVTYDSTVYTVTFVVNDDGNGLLSGTRTYSNGTATVPVVTFRNSYTPQPIVFDLTATKQVVDTAGKVLTGQDFSPEGFAFELLDSQGKVLANAHSDEDGLVTFAGLTAAAAGEYHYRIREVAGNKPGYRYDATVWCAHVQVTYDAATGRLQRSAVHMHPEPAVHDASTSTQNLGQILFKNVYAPTAAEVVILGEKTLTGRDLREHEFSFRMTDKATGLIAAETRNHADGRLAFYLRFTQAGSYTYQVQELVPNAPLGGVTYATNTCELTVTVTDDGSGALKATVGGITPVNGVADLSQTLRFENTYKAQSTTVALQAMKELRGMDLSEGRFHFELVRTEADFTTPIAAPIVATNALDGIVHFAPITYVNPGSYYYTVSEQVPEGDRQGVTYDQTVYRVTVTVTDDLQGSLVSSVSLQRADGREVGRMLFQNSYAASGEAQVTLQVKKTVSGMTDPSGFVFGLYADGSTQPLQTVTSDSDGVVDFPVISFEGAGQYTFYVREVLPVVDGKPVAVKDRITYDQTEYRVDITVADNGVGGFTATYTVDGKAVDPDTWQFAFHNSYEKPPADNPQTGDDTNLTLLLVLALSSALGLAIVPVLRRRSR